jgi:cell division protein FtsL
MSRRVRPIQPASKIVPAILALTIVAIGFAMLRVRLEVTAEGYRLSQLQSDIEQEQERNRRLRLQVAELSSHQELRAMAAKYHLAAPQRGQVVIVP